MDDKQWERIGSIIPKTGNTLHLYVKEKPGDINIQIGSFKGDPPPLLCASDLISGFRSMKAERREEVSSIIDKLLESSQGTWVSYSVHEVTLDMERAHWIDCVFRETRSAIAWENNMGNAGEIFRSMFRPPPPAKTFVIG